MEIEDIADADSWEVYFAETDDGQMSILVNLDAEPSEETPRPMLGRVLLEIRKPDENGFADEEEHDHLTDLLEALDTAVSIELNGLLVGRTMGQGVCTFFFYLPAEEGFAGTAEKVMAAYPDYRFQTVAENDEHWEAYFDFLSPSAESLEFIQNARILDVLLENGDDLDTPREVTHWAYFPTVAARDEFKAELLAQNYAIEEETNERDDTDDEETTEETFGLVFSSVRDVNLEGMSIETLKLRTLAARFDGEYDGWETAITKADGAPDDLSIKE